MSHSLGLLFAGAAMFFWVIGDFLIQRGTRKFGDWATLFLIGFVGMIGIFPFVYGELAVAFESFNLKLLLLLSVVTLFSALFLFEGLKRGKLAVIEPVFGLELPFTVGFSAVFGGENLAPALYAFIALIFVGLLFTATRDIRHLRFNRTMLEKGVVLAGIGSVGMGLMNFLTGYGSRTISPLLTIWFMHSFLAIICFFYLMYRGELRGLARRVLDFPKTALGLSVFDNLAWISFAFAMSFISISIATAISESYIAFSVLLGIFVNHERIKAHQIVGIVAVATGVVVLSFFAA